MKQDIDYARYDRIRPIRWTGDTLDLLDQRKLPFTVEYTACRTSGEVAQAIHALIVRGARSDILASDAAERMVARLPGARLVTVPDVGHAPTLDEREAVVAIDGLLAEL